MSLGEPSPWVWLRDGDDRLFHAVHGVDRLWVADASVMPTIPSAGTNLPTIVVAERIAAWLVE